MDKYIRHTWVNDEVIDAEKLNNIEEGIAEAKKQAERVPEEEIQQAVAEYLEAAKESGDFDGPPGTSVTVSGVSESAEDGGNNVVTFSDGKTLNVKNGQKGYTPVRGTDYWTEADKQSMVNDVLAALPDAAGVSY